MTAPKRVLRPRRARADDRIPAELAAWFAGEREPEAPPPWAALIPPECDLLQERWAAWVAEHPHAMPPAGWEWLVEGPPERRHGMPYEAAKKLIARAGKR